jgi:uncharacterized protein
MRVLVAGGRPAVSLRVCQLLTNKQHDVWRLGLPDYPAPPGVQSGPADTTHPDSWLALINSDTAIINLTGADPHHAPDGQIATTQSLVQAMAIAPHKPHTLLQGSTVAYYGDGGDDLVIEASPPGRDPAAAAAAAFEALTAGILARQCWLRFGPVLDSDLDVQTAASAAWVPWVHVTDAARAICFLLDDPIVEGPVNIVAPQPTTYTSLTQVLDTHGLHQPAQDHCPLPSQRVIPHQLLRLGFRFIYAEAQDALRCLIG